jgi:hypothetical protein
MNCFQFGAADLARFGFKIEGLARDHSSGHACGAREF